MCEWPADTWSCVPGIEIDLNSVLWVEVPSPNCPYVLFPLVYIVLSSHLIIIWYCPQETSTIFLSPFELVGILLTSVGTTLFEIFDELIKL